jgi:hypothetical protein
MHGSCRLVFEALTEVPLCWDRRAGATHTERNPHEAPQVKDEEQQTPKPRSAADTRSRILLFLVVDAAVDADQDANAGGYRNDHKNYENSHNSCDSFFAFFVTLFMVVPLLENHGVI